MNIYQKMSAITAELQTVAKNLEVGAGKNAYKAVGESDVLRAVKPVEAKYGIYSYPFSRDIVESDVITSVGYDGKERKSLYLRIRTVYRFVNAELPEEYIDITSFADGIDSADKATGKAMTYCDKYALLKAYKINTGEDPDSVHSDAVVGDNLTKTGNNTSVQKTPENGLKTPLTQGQIIALHKYDGNENLVKALKYYGVERIEDLTVEQASSTLKAFAQKGM